MRLVKVMVLGFLAGSLAWAQPSLRALRISHPPRIDGHLDEPMWGAAPAASNFSEEWPEKGAPARQATQVRVLYDSHFLYVGARMHHDLKLDGGKAAIVKRLHRRDQDSQSDWFGVAIDSLHDHRTAFFFQVNAAGVQRDQLIFNDSNFDSSWDGVWESAVSADAEGWTAELKIPLSLLRFRAGEGPQSWGINFERNDQGAVRELSRWRVVPRGEGGYVSRFWNLEGIEGIQPQLRREFIPYVSAARKFETAQSYDDRRWTNRAGLDVHWGLSPHAQADLSIRPDFGQVEVDQVVLNLSTIETFFPEKRPFFLEGSELFKVAGPDLFYSRRIGAGVGDPSLAAGETLLDRPLATDITAAAKYTSKYDSNTHVGLLGASVEPARATVLDANGARVKREISPLTNFGVLRVQQHLDERGSYVGGFASAVDQAGPAGRQAQVLATDGVLRSADRSRFLEYTLSHSNAGAPGAVQQGWRGRFVFRQDWRSGWSAELSGVHAGKDYNPNDAGFLNRADERNLAFFLLRVWDKPAGPLRTREASLFLQEAQDQTGRTFRRHAELNATATFASLWGIWGGVGLDLPVEDDRELRTFTSPVKRYLQVDRVPQANLNAETPDNRRWFLQARVARAWYEGGPSTNARLFQIIKPTQRLEIQFDTNVSRNEGERRWLATVGVPITGLRRLSLFNQALRAGYAFTPTFTLQLYSQWLAANWNFRDLQAHLSDTVQTSTLPGDPGSTAASLRTWNLNLISRWEFRPGSTAFLVYTHGVNTDALINGRASLSPRPDLAVLRHLPSDDTLQVKVSFLFR